NQRGRKHPALTHYHDDAFETQREAAGRDVFAEKHADEVVITPAAAERARQIGNIDFDDCAGVVRQPARQRRIELDSLIDSTRFGELQNLSQIVDAARADLVTADEFNQPAQNVRIVSSTRI